CVARPAAGQACAAPNDCQVGLFCDPVSAKCVAPVASGALGDACNPFESILTAFPTCAAGLYCKYSVATTPPSGQCSTRLAMGAACNPSDTPVGADQQCVDGAACFQTSGQPNPSCQPWVRLNMPCDPANDTCMETLYCDAASRTCLAYLAD